MKPFARSVERHSPLTDILILTSKEEIDKYMELKKINPRIQVEGVEYPPGIAQGRMRLIKKVTKRVKSLALGQIQRVLLRENGFEIERNYLLKRTTTQMHFLIRRFFWSRKVLERSSFQIYERIMLSDCRDVIVQRDPFLEIERGLMTGAEGKRIQECKINKGWIAQAYGREKLSELGDKEILCAGVILGMREDVVIYLEEFCREVERVVMHKRMTYLQNLDQAIHNKILRQDLDDRTRECGPDGMISTFGYICKDTISLDALEGLIYVNGEVPAIIHQYDRNERVADFVGSLYEGY